MRRYINEIDKKILNIVYTREELNEMKEFTKVWKNIEYEKHKLEIKIKDDLKGYVIGELEDVELNYISFNDTFYISYKDDNKLKKNLFKRIKDFLWK